MRTKPFLSIACLVSRSPELLIDSLERLKVPRFATELVFLVDGKMELASRYLERFEDGWFSVTAKLTGGQPNTVNTTARRQRITENMSLLQKMVGDSQFVMGIEDDTVVPDDAFERLYRVTTRYEAAYVSGVQLGRHNLPYVGAWRCDDVLAPTRISTLPYREQGIEEVDGGGLYCYLTSTKYFKRARMKYGDFGPDFYYVYSLRKRNLKCYVDWSVKCGHQLGDTGNIIYPQEGVAVVPFIKRGDSFVRENTLVAHKNIR